MSDLYLFYFRSPSILFRLWLTLTPDICHDVASLTWRGVGLPFLLNLAIHFFLWVSSVLFCFSCDLTPFTFFLFPSFLDSLSFRFLGTSMLGSSKKTFMLRPQLFNSRTFDVVGSNTGRIPINSNHSPFSSFPNAQTA